MNKDFSEIMSQRTDKELAEILSTKRHEYQPEAIAAAQDEFEKRSLDVNDLVTVEEIKKSKEENLPVEKQDQKLAIGYKFFTAALFGFITYIFRLSGISSPFVLVFSLPTTIVIQVLIFKKLKENGFDRMALDFKLWSLNTWIFYSAIFLIFLVF